MSESISDLLQDGDSLIETPRISIESREEISKENVPKSILTNVSADVVFDEDSQNEFVDEQLLSPGKYTDDSTNQAEDFSKKSDNFESNLVNYYSITDHDLPEFSSLANKQIDRISINLAEKPIKKRRRTVNKMSQDPEKLPLRDLLFYNPPETVFQKENRELYEENSESKSKILRRHSVESSTSDKGKINVSSENNQGGDKSPSSEQNDKGSTSPSSTNQVLTIDESGNIVFENPEQTSSTVSTTSRPEVKMKSLTTYNSFKRNERSKNLWNAEETGTFYTALEIVGTDFTLMEAVFFKDKGRNRKQLKQKFKREEKINRAYIDEILYKSLRNRSRIRLDTELKNANAET
ncbi:Transcription factor TFIIIB component B'' -like protein [Sarcoptes scabiei]|uniref:Transcription factor TFIIIB component B'' -like protein n=1 Tax=Sarcoptes scabiei TaxID=52283 RepID=A0A131ZY65_SARSC|nr:Transcription factor TFIIIB component B'' -like protein [Sarcoptes scabiei]KPM03621.1 hypothetical protein QR98_0020540 [Sarcoptes scabiei]